MAPRQNLSHEKELKEVLDGGIHVQCFPCSRYPSSLTFSIYPTNYIIARTRCRAKICRRCANLVCHAKWTVTFMVKHGCSLSTRCCPTVSPEILQGTGISMTSANPVKKTPPTNNNNNSNNKTRFRRGNESAEALITRN